MTTIYVELLRFSLTDFGKQEPRHLRILAVPPHIVDVSPSLDFLPPPVDPKGRLFRAVFIIEDKEQQDSQTSTHELPGCLLKLSGQEYHDIRFVDLMFRIEEALDTVHGQPEWKRVVTQEGRRWYID